MEIYRKKQKKPRFRYSYRAYIGTSEGKKHYKRFTGISDISEDFAKVDAIKKAKAYLAKAETYGTTGDITLGQAFAEYIAVKENILSPPTIRAYSQIAKNAFPALQKMKVSNITQIAVQSAVNQLAAHSSPKSIRNAHGFLSAVLKMYRPDFILRTTLPRKQSNKPFIPENDEIHRLLTYLRIRDTEMYKAVLLASFGSLRRSEISALTEDDIDGDVVSVTKAVVEDKNGEYVVKNTTKSEAGTRDVTMPHDVIVQLVPHPDSENGRIVDLLPGIITHRFTRALEKSGIKHFRFHDLRHYQASILHAMGVPDKYIMERCGWKTESTMRNIYQHTMSKKRKQVEAEICSYFSSEFRDTFELDESTQI